MVRIAAPLAVAASCAAFAANAFSQDGAASDRGVLETLYRATGGDDWTDNTNWLTTAPLGDWHGVEVDEDGRVTGLRLGGWDEAAQGWVDHQLTGSLPPALGTLSRLRRLEISGNGGLTGPIPPELGSPGDLEELILQANSLTGSIPAALGHLSSLKRLLLGFNLLSGQIPPEFGNLTGLEHLEVGDTMLSGPLPESLTALSTLDWLRLEGSGLCVPDAPAFEAWVAAIRDFTGAVCAGSTTFLRVVTQPGLGRRESVHAVADLNGDGRDDLLTGEYQEYYVGAPEERLTKATLRILVGERDGSFADAPELIEGTVDARTPIVVADDFNGDGRTDLAVFDAGVYVREQSQGYGNPPQLFLSGRDGRLRPSDALADAVRREHELRPHPRYSDPADLHLKSATSGDVDGDGDIDLWVDSIGGANVSSHFMVNDGHGTFTLHEARAPPALRYNPPEGWYHLHGHLVDVDNDGDIDLALGQNRSTSPATINQFSIVLVNDGAGRYPARIELPHPAFNDGYTQVTGQTHFDVDGDGFQDLLLAHVRNDAALPGIPYTGRYIQVLLNRGGVSFGDETTAWMGDQGATTPERNPEGDPLYNAGMPGMYDIDRDGCADLVMSRGNLVRAESPLVYRNDGSGRFQAMSPVTFTGSARAFGLSAVPADVDGDTVIDFVVPHGTSGPDRRYGTADDFTILVTLLNTTPVGPLRCGALSNRAPTTVGTLSDRALALGGTLNVDVSRAFVDPDGDALTFAASSSAPTVVTASVAGALVTLAAASEGAATIRVTATDPGGSSATQSFTVTVVATTMSFTDHPIQPGVTPVKAIHFTELRMRIDALRRAGGLQAFPWTDAVLRVGVTPVRLVHLLELRSALAAAYAAAGRVAPRWTDASPAPRSAPIRAAHLTELRDAVLALE